MSFSPEYNSWRERTLRLTAISTVEVLQELNDLAKKSSAALRRGEDEGLDESLSRPSCETTNCFHSESLARRSTSLGVGKELIELLLIRSVPSLDLAVQLRRRGFDVGVANALVFNMPTKFGLELMTIGGSHIADAERELVDDGNDDVDRV
jgi:hypothetical protein